jgi:O-antigen ligase
MLAAVSAPVADADAPGPSVLESSVGPWLNGSTIVATAALTALTVVLYLVGDWPWPAPATLRALALASAIGVIPWLARRVRPAAALVPYGLFALTLAIAWIAAPTAEATRELWRYSLFLVVIAAAAAPPAVPRGALVGLHTGCLLLVLLQLAGPRYAFDYIGRAGSYAALQQWSGYPELGLLMAVGVSAMVGVLCTARRVVVCVAAVVLAAAFAAGAMLLQSRSAVVTIPIAAVWLLGLAALRWRSRIAFAGIAIVIAAAALAGVRGGGASALASRAADAYSRELGIREQGWNAARLMAREHPYVGVGLGGYQREYLKRQLGWDSSHAYNIVLHVLAETGAIGLVGWLALWGRALWLGIRRASRTPSGSALFALHGMLVAFLVRSQSEHFLANLMTSDRLLLLVALWIGLTEGLALDAARQPGTPPAADAAGAPSAGEQQAAARGAARAGA